MGKATGRPQDFEVHQIVRYRPGVGSPYIADYREVLDADGYIPAIVVGHTPTRVRIQFDMPRAIGGGVRSVTRSVNATSLQSVGGARAAARARRAVHPPAQSVLEHAGASLPFTKRRSGVARRRVSESSSSRASDPSLAAGDGPRDRES